MKRFICTVCKYTYDPQAGDPDGKAEANTPFRELPEDWLCPICDAEKDAFEAMGGAETKTTATRRYRRPGLTIIWQSSLCNHNGNCIRSLPQVFDLDKRPWVNVDGADVDEIRRVIDECPTGALSYQDDAS